LNITEALNSRNPDYNDEDKISPTYPPERNYESSAYVDLFLFACYYELGKI